MPIRRGFDVLREVARAQMRGGRSSPARERLRSQALALAADEALVDAAFAWQIVPIDGEPSDTLQAGGESLHAPKLLPPSGALTALGCAVCTLGNRLEHRVRALFTERRASLAVALDELGNELLFAVARRAQDRLQAEVDRRGWSMAGELRPGDPGLALEAQPAVLRLAGADAIGVGTTPQLLMQPAKSTSMLLGIGVDLPPARWSRCDECPRRKGCRAAARAPAAPPLAP